MGAQTLTAKETKFLHMRRAGQSMVMAIQIAFMGLFLIFAVVAFVTGGEALSMQTVAFGLIAVGASIVRFLDKYYLGIIDKLL